MNGVKDDFSKRPTLVSIETEESAPTILPEKIGPYKVESLLNKGGMSVLYLGINPETKEPLTIKVLSQKYLANPDVVKRFMREAEIIEMANHNNIVKIYGHGRWEGGLYIAMEFIQGISLREMILQQAMSLGRALEIVLQIAQALTHLHAHGIIHRDLKPENILLTSTGGIKVIDFGIAALYEVDSKAAKDSKKRFMGTPAYMSPEQQEDANKATFASDIYALGIITYELVLGRLSYGVIHLSLMPKGLQKILSKALQPKLENRYPDIVDFMTDISLYLSSEEWKQDRRGADFLGELNESLKEAQSFLITDAPPLWKGIEVAIASNCNTALSTVYFDFFERKNGSFSVLLAESLKTGVEGLLHMALLRGMVRSISRFIEDPKELIEILNDTIINEHKEMSFSLSLLTLFPVENRFTYISCGYSPLWYLPYKSEVPRKLSSDNIAIGITTPYDVLEIDSNFNIGDTIILHSFQAAVLTSVADVESDENEFLEALKENIYLPPKKQVDAIFRKVTKNEKGLFERPVTLISIGRIS